MKVTLEEKDKGERREKTRWPTAGRQKKCRDSVYVCADAGGGGIGTGAVQRERNREKDVYMQAVAEKEKQQCVYVR